MRMTCPLTFAKESLAINPVDSLESDSTAWYIGQISLVSSYWPTAFSGEVSTQDVHLRRCLRWQHPIRYHLGFNGIALRATAPQC